MSLQDIDSSFQFGEDPPWADDPPIPTEFTREDAEREAKSIYSVQDYDWEKFPENVRLGLMLDAAMLIISRMIIERKA